MRQIMTRTRLLALSIVLAVVMITSCAPDHVQLRVGVGVGVSPYFHHPGFFSYPYLLDDPYGYDLFWDDLYWHDPWGLYAPPWPYHW
jgi:hypothetical protein